MSEINRGDVQGLAAFGYGKLVEAVYLLLRIRDLAAARTWLASAPVSTAEWQPAAPDTALQIAFTLSGMRALGLAENVIAQFSPEFIAGMSDPNRARRLGDIGESDPANWQWGGSNTDIHVVVMLYAKSNLASWRRSVEQTWGNAFEIVTTLDTSDMGEHEPFGFKDGISQPEFDWKLEQPATPTTATYNNRVALGELLLGYPNEYGKYTQRPLVEPSDDPANLLASASDQPSQKDLGLNGTYVALRQLEQDVRGFWQYLNRAANGDAAERYRLGAAMVGRTIDGDPLIPAAKSGDVPANEFTYDGDPGGVQCPFGAHVRRANPRNADLFGHPAGFIANLSSQIALPRPKLRDDLMASTRFHRVLRRGREYGVKLAPEDALAPPPADEQPRGLQFAALCANLTRQFEFVQNAWLMSTKFNGLTGESDPLLGNRSAVGDCPVTGNFSIPHEGQVARRLTQVPRFITVRGGLYLFLPGVRALRYIARAGNAVSPQPGKKP